MTRCLARLTATVTVLAAAAVLALPAAGQDLLIPRRQPISCSTARPYAYYQATVDSTHAVIGWYCSAAAPAGYIMTSLTATALELNTLHSVTAGTTSASKGLVVDANKALDTLNIVTPRWGAGTGTALTLTAAEANALHGTTSTAAELNVLHSVTAGTVAASSGVVVDANKAVDVLQAKTSESLGGTGVPGAATVATKITKAVTAIADATATDLVTVTVPNSAQSAVVHVRIVGSLGAGGAIGANECSAVIEGNVTFARTTGVAAVGTAATGTMTSSACVAGATTITLAYSLSAVSGAVGASNTFTIKGTITKGGGASANHTALVAAEVDNANASGVTIQ